MAYAVSAWFDPTLEDQVRAIWRILSEAALSSTLHTGPYRPHVTLGICEELDRGSFSSDLHRALQTSRAGIPVALPSLGVFHNDPPVLFLGVTVSRALLELHALVHRLLARHGRRPHDYFLPDRWNPHCTLAPSIETTKLMQAVALSSELKLPLVGAIRHLGIIDTPAEVELEAIKLE